jgi:WD40 repeat protein
MHLRSKLQITTEDDNDADNERQASKRMREVEDAMLRLRNLRRFGGQAQLGDGGWGVGPTAWSTVQEALNAPRTLWDSVVSESSEAVGLEFDELPEGAGPFALQRKALPPFQRELEFRVDRIQRARMLSALPADAAPQVLLRRRNVSVSTSPYWRTLYGTGGPVTSVMFVGVRAVAAGCADGQLRIWDASTAVCLQNWPHGWNGTPAITAIAQAIIPSSYGRSTDEVDAAIPGRLMASAAEDGTVALWLLQSIVPGLVAMIPRYADEVSGDENSMKDRAVRSVEFSSDGRVLATGGDDGTVQLRLTDEIGKTQAPPVIAGNRGDSAVLCMVWSQDNRNAIFRRTSTLSLVVGHANGELSHYAVSISKLHAGVSLAEPVQVRKWSAHDSGSPVRAVAMSPQLQVKTNGEMAYLVASASDDNLLKLWRIHKPATSAPKMADVAISALSAEPSEIHADDGESGGMPLGVEKMATLEGHSGPVYSCCFHPGGHTLASGSEDEQVRLWSIAASDTTLAPSTSSQQEPAGLGKQFVCKQVLDVDRGTQQEEVMGLAYSPDGGYLVTGQSDHAIHLWEPRLFPTQAAVDEAAMDSFDSQDVVNRLASAAHDTVSVDVSPDGMTVLSASGRNATVWDVETCNPRTPCEHLDAVSCSAFSPDGKLLVTGSNDEVVRVWTADGAELVKVFAARFELVQGKLRAPGEMYNSKKKSQKKSSHHAVRDVAWSSCGSRVAAACWDRMVRVWDYHSAALLCTLHGHAHCPTAVAFGAHDAEVIAAGDDGTVRVWDAPPARVDETVALAASYPRSAASAPKSRGHHTLAIVLPPKVTLSDAVGGNRLKSLCSTDDIIAAGSEDGGLYLWDSKGYTSLACFRCPASSETPLCSPAGEAGALKLLVSAGKLAQPSVTSVAASPDGMLLAATYADRWLRIWQVSSGAAIGAMRMPRQCTGVAFSGDRKAPRLAVACGSEVRWFDLYAWQELAQYYPGLMESVYQPLPVVSKTEILAKQKEQDEDKPEAIFARAISRGLATPATVETMRKSIEKGELPENHYANLWCVRHTRHAHATHATRPHTQACC